MSMKDAIFGTAAPSSHGGATYRDSIQAWLPVKNIIGGVVITKDNRFIKILEVLPVNFYLKSPADQQNIITSYAAYLKIAPDSRSCEVRTLPPDTSEYVEKMRQFQKTEESENCRAEIEDNIEKIGLGIASESIRQQVKNIFANKKKAQRNDLNKIKIVLEKEKKANQEGSSKTETISDAETCLGREEYQYSKAYTLSSTEYFLISEYYKQNKNFDKIILSSYGWQVPYKTANGEHGVASLAPKANSFEWVSETDNDQGKAIWPPKEDEISSILTKNLNKNTKIKDITFLNNILYALDMVYIKCNNASYIIPYPENPEALNADAGKYKIETGKCYRVDKFIKIMNSMFDESGVKNSDSNTVGSIALPYRKSYTLLYVIAAGILIGIIVLIAVFRHRFFHITQ